MLTLDQRARRSWYGLLLLFSLTQALDLAVTLYGIRFYPEGNALALTFLALPNGLLAFKFVLTAFYAVGITAYYRRNPTWARRLMLALTGLMLLVLGLNMLALLQA